MTPKVKHKCCCGEIHPIDTKTMEVAEEYTGGVFIYNIEFHVFLSAAEYMRDRILGMLKNDSALTGTPGEIANWLEQKLKEEK